MEDGKNRLFRESISAAMCIKGEGNAQRDDLGLQWGP